MQILLSVADAARLLGVTPQTVRIIANRGALKVTTRTEGGIRLFSRSEVERVRDQRAAQRKPLRSAPAGP